MKHYVNYGNQKKEFSLPKGWNPISAEDKPPIPGVNDPIQEIKRALDHPIGSPKIEELARPGWKWFCSLMTCSDPLRSILLCPRS